MIIVGNALVSEDILEKKFEKVESKSIFQFINSITSSSEGLIFLIFASVDIFVLGSKFIKYPFFSPSSTICAIVL